MFFTSFARVKHRVLISTETVQGLFLSLSHALVMPLNFLFHNLYIPTCDSVADSFITDCLHAVVKGIHYLTKSFHKAFDIKKNVAQCFVNNILVLQYHMKCYKLEINRYNFHCPKGNSLMPEADFNKCLKKLLLHSVLQCGMSQSIGCAWLSTMKDIWNVSNSNCIPFQVTWA
jgi:hypothetical protein